MNKVNGECRVFDKNLGPLKVKNLTTNNEILCKIDGIDSYCAVNSILKTTEQKSFCITFSNGSVVRVSNLIDETNSPSHKEINNIINSDIGWMIGAHLGDGNCDRKLIENINESYYKYRVRFNGDNEKVVSEYSKVINNVTNSNNIYSKISRYSNNVDVWEYCISNKKVQEFVNYYLDGQFGNKTHTGFVPKYISENSYWLSFIAGLIDSDGYIKSNGSVDIAICMAEVINDVCIFLSTYGVEYKHTYKITKRENESNIHRLVIYFRNEIVKTISHLMKHNDKVNKISSSTSIKKFKSGKYEVSNEIIQKILNTKLDYNDNRYSNMCAIKSIVRKSGNLVGLASLSLFKDLGSISIDEYYEIINKCIISKVNVNEIVEDFYEIHTSSGNYYAGEYGLVLLS